MNLTLSPIYPALFILHHLLGITFLSLCLLLSLNIVIFSLYVVLHRKQLFVQLTNVKNPQSSTTPTIPVAKDYISIPFIRNVSPYNYYVVATRQVIILSFELEDIVVCCIK